MMNSYQKLKYEIAQKDRQISDLHVLIDTLQTNMRSAMSYLTDEQKKKMAEARAERSKGGGRGQGQPRPGGFSRSNPFASLGLKEEQQKKLDAARQEMSTQMRALFSRDSDTPREERTAKLQKAREAYEATIKKTLTAEQFKKYEAAQAARPERGQRRPGGGSTKPGGGRPRPDGKSKERPKRSDA